MTTELIYLASPYSHPDRAVRVARFEAVNHLAANLMRDGLAVYSPISHTHSIAEAGGLPLGWDYWESYDRTIMAVCSRMIVFCQDGWRDSRGVQAEIAIANDLGIPVEYVNASEQWCAECEDYP